MSDINIADIKRERKDMNVKSKEEQEIKLKKAEVRKTKIMLGKKNR